MGMLMLKVAFPIVTVFIYGFLKTPSLWVFWKCENVSFHLDEEILSHDDSEEKLEV